MKKIIPIIILFVLCSSAFSQQKKLTQDQRQIQKTVKGFLNWYKKLGHDTVNVPRLINGGYPDTTTFMQINMDTIEKYLDLYKKSTYVSKSFINNLRQTYKEISNDLLLSKRNEGLIDGMETDLILDSFEPEKVLDHVKEGKFLLIYVLSNKAIVKFTIGNQLKLLFSLTKSTDKIWQIEDIGYYEKYF